MNSGELIPSNHDRSEPASSEVQFALVIARMIDTVKNSPEHMRQAVYDLARYKLQEQFTYADAKDIKRIQQALETAIRGVEEFSKQQLSDPAPAVSAEVSEPVVAALSPPRPPSQELTEQARTRAHLEFDPDPNDSIAPSTPLQWPLLKRTAVMVAIFVGILLAVQQREHLLSLAHSLPKLDWKAPNDRRNLADQLATSATVSNDPGPPPQAKPALLRPTDYGVYAVSDDSLTELQLLPGRPPDIRVGVSAALKIPSRTFLSNGHPKFIVFRRDVASNISDRAEVRILARIAREFSAEVIGKKPGDSEDTWVIRNISFPFRSSPLNDNPEMYELHSEDPALELTPGRYALVLKSQAFDFSVAGETVDPKHCIERIVAANGTFYSDCKKP